MHRAAQKVAEESPCRPIFCKTSASRRAVWPRVPPSRRRRSSRSRSAWDLFALARSAERELAALDGQLALENATPLTEVIGQGLASRQLPTVLVGAFGALALLLASVGVYAMFASMVVAREGEFAVRMALGSRRVALASLVLRQAAGWMALGSTVSCTSHGS